MDLDNIANEDNSSISHLPIIIEKDFSQNQDFSRINSANIKSEPIVKNEQTRDICKFYQLNRWCKFGKNCRYSHNNIKNTLIHNKNSTENVLVDEKMASDVQLSKNDGNILSSEKIIDIKIPKTSNPIILKEENCIFFMKGYCRLGRHCRFLHDKEHRSLVRSKLKIETNFNKPISVSKNVRKDKASLAADANVLHSTQVDSSGKSSKMIEIEQFLKRYPDAIISEVDQSTILSFSFSSTDPDWPFIVKEINIQLTLPQYYPQQNLQFNVVDNEILPEILLKLLEDEANKWIDEKHTRCVDTLLVRPMLHWLNNHLEDIFTRGLTKLKMERQAQAAGLEFIPSSQLKIKYSGSQSQPNSEESSSLLNKTNSQSKVVNFGLEEENESEKENLNLSKEAIESNSNYLLNEVQSGTELSFRDLEFTSDTIATIGLEYVGLIVSCGRCNRKFDINIQNQNVEGLVCLYCKQSMQCMLRSSLVHAHSNVFGYVDAINCSVIDCILPDCCFNITCLNCSHITIMMTLATGQPNITWCRNCHKKFTVLTNSIKILKHAPSANLKLTGEPKVVCFPKKKKVPTAPLR